MLTPTYDLSYNGIYPSDWKYGNLAGSIELIRDKIRIRSPYCYQLISYNKNDLQNVINQLYKLNLDSTPLEKIKNRIRFISNELAEVELSINKIAIIDRINLPKIIGYDLSVKEKKTKNGLQYYPLYCIKKIHKPLYKLFLNTESIYYKDGNPLNLTLNNLGKHEDKLNIKLNENIVYINSNNWLGGKYAGTIFCRSNDSAWNMVIKDNNDKIISKYFKFNETNKQQKYDELNKIRMKLSDDLKLTRNKYRFIDNDTIEVKLDKDDQTFITDSKFISIINEHTLFVVKSSNDNAKYYVGMLIDGKNKCFHNYITGYNFVDHIDRNPLNNKLSNLRDSNPSKNNKNKTVGPKVYNPDYLCGVRIIEKNNKEIITTYVKNDNYTYTKSFSTSVYGYNNALKMAIKWRLEKLKQFKSSNWHENDIITLYDLPKLDIFFYNIDTYLDDITKNNSVYFN
jgi:hypothetical protein